MTSSPLARLLALRAELAAFGTVGGLAFLVDVGAFNLLRVGIGVGPLTSKAASVLLAASVAFALNRWWTFRHRAGSRLRRDYVVFLGLNAVGLAIGLTCLAVSHYLLGLTSTVADNISGNVVGLALGTAFRFWSYRRFVFLDPDSGTQPQESGRDALLVPVGASSRAAASSSEYPRA